MMLQSKLDLTGSLIPLVAFIMKIDLACHIRNSMVRRIMCIILYLACHIRNSMVRTMMFLSSCL